MMRAFDSLIASVQDTDGFSAVSTASATSEALESCEALIGARLPASLKEVLLISDGFELVDSHGSVLRLYPASEIVSATFERRRLYGRPDGASPWGDFIEIARSDHTESTYALRPLVGDQDESPLYEITSEGWDLWLIEPPIQPSFGDWLRSIGEAIANQNHERLYDVLSPDRSVE